jgi:hypothetical protein
MASAQERLRIAATAHHRRRIILLGIQPSALTSTLTSSASSFTAGGAGVTLTFTARDASNNLIEGYTPVPEEGVV